MRTSLATSSTPAFGVSYKPLRATQIFLTMAIHAYSCSEQAQLSRIAIDIPFSPKYLVISI